MNKHAIMNNTHFKSLSANDKETLLRNAALEHYNSHNNKQILDGNGTTVDVKVLNVSLKEYSARVCESVKGAGFGFQLCEIKTVEANLSIPARNARKHVSNDLRNFCGKYFTDIFDELLKEKKQKEQEKKDAEKEAAERLEAAKRAAKAEKEAAKKAMAEEQQKRDNIMAILKEAAEEEWE